MKKLTEMPELAKGNTNRIRVVSYVLCFVGSNPTLCNILSYLSW